MTALFVISDIENLEHDFKLVIVSKTNIRGIDMDGSNKDEKMEAKCHYNNHFRIYK